ncbi:MAG: DUF2189 domain-containing protein [Rhodospirillaceae bacterium]|nr:DUF2189 domain-containing protein [Rhodospirillaceae bacterium]
MAQTKPAEFELGGDMRGIVLPINRIEVDATWVWLRKGWQDFQRAKAVDLCFGLAIAAVSFLIIYMAWQANMFAYVWPLAAGFMFLAPLLGICFYEGSRRLEQNQPINLVDIALAWRQRPGQIFALGAIMMLFQVAWIYIAILLYAIFFGGQPISWSGFVLDTLLSVENLPFWIVGISIGAVFAALSFAISVVSFPLLLDRNVSVPQAIATSLAASIVNWRVLIGWGALIVLFSAAGIVTGCIGLIVTMPLLGHASWHAYRDLVAPPR